MLLIVGYMYQIERQLTLIVGVSSYYQVFKLQLAGNWETIQETLIHITCIW